MKDKHDLQDVLYQQQARLIKEELASEKKVFQEHAEGEALKYWRTLTDRRNKRGSGNEAWSEWQTGMAEIWHNCVTLNKALCYTLDAKGRPHDAIVGFLWEKGSDVTKEVIKNIWQNSSESGRKVLDTLGYHSPLDKEVRFLSSIDSETGILESVLYFDGKPLPLEQDGKQTDFGKAFMPAIVAWLNFKGWKYDATDKTVRNQQGNKMTSEEYVQVAKEIRSADINGLKAFLEKETDMEIAPYQGMKL